MEKQPDKQILEHFPPGGEKPSSEGPLDKSPVQPPQKKGAFPKWIMYVLIVVIGLGVGGIGVGAYYYLTKKDKEEAAPEVSSTDTDTTTDDQDTTDTDTDDTDTTDEYEGWKTYSNSDNNYSFMYPSDWSVKKLSNDISRQVGGGSFTKDHLQLQTSRDDLWAILRLDPDIAMQELDTELKDTLSVKIDKNIIANKEVWYGDDTKNTVVKAIYYTKKETKSSENFFYYKTGIFQFETMLTTNVLTPIDKDTFEEFMTKFEKVLASITAQSNGNIDDNTEDYTGWDTYESMEYGFSFKYPSGWSDPELSKHLISETICVSKCSVCNLTTEDEEKYSFSVVINPTDWQVPEQIALNSAKYTYSGSDTRALWFKVDEYDPTGNYENWIRYLGFFEQPLTYTKSVEDCESDHWAFNTRFFSSENTNGWEMYQKILNSFEVDEEFFD